MIIVERFVMTQLEDKNPISKNPIYSSVNPLTTKKEQERQEYLKNFLPEGINITPMVEKDKKNVLYSVGKDYRNLNELASKLNEKGLSAELQNTRRGLRIAIRSTDLSTFMKKNPEPKEILDQEIYGYNNQPPLEDAYSLPNATKKSETNTYRNTETKSDEYSKYQEGYRTLAEMKEEESNQHTYTYPAYAIPSNTLRKDSEHTYSLLKESINSYQDKTQNIYEDPNHIYEKIQHTDKRKENIYEDPDHIYKKIKENTYEHPYSTTEAVLGGERDKTQHIYENSDEILNKKPAGNLDHLISLQNDLEKILEGESSTDMPTKKAWKDKDLSGKVTSIMKGLGNMIGYRPDKTPPTPPPRPSLNHKQNTR